MTIAYTPLGIWREIQYAEKQNNKRIGGYESLRRGYYTPFFMDDVADGERPDSRSGDDDRWFDPENHSYEFASFIVPQLVNGNPAFHLRSRRTSSVEEEQDEAKALEYALNQWVQDVDYRTTMDALALDPLFAFGAALVTPKRNRAAYQRSSAHENWPEVQRISPRNFFRDPAALRLEECRYLGHRWVMDAADLRAMAEAADEDAGWDLEVVKGLEGIAMSEEYRPSRATQDAPERGEVELFEFWFRSHVYRPEDYADQDTSDEAGDDVGQVELDEKDGFHGTIFTLAVVRGGPESDQEHGTHAFVRKPRAYYGHGSGPYAVCQMMRVPDDPWGLAPLVATQGQARDLNALTRAQNDDIRSYKRQLFVEDDSGQVLEALENSPHRTVIPLRGLGATKRVADMVQAVEVGGPSQALQAAIELSHARLRRNSGMGEAQTGNAPQDTTATASAIASQDAGTRIERMKEQWRRFHEDVALKAAFYIGTSKDIEILLDTKASEELGGPSMPGTYKGGALTPADFEHLQVVIDVVSVERTTEDRAQARLMQASGMLMQAIPAVMQVPSMDFWGQLFELVGNTLNVPDMGKLGESLVTGALSVLSGDIPSLATRTEQASTPGVNPGGPYRPSSAQRPAGPSPMPRPQGMAGQQPQQSQNRTPGLTGGVPQPVPLPGVGGSSAR